MDTLSDAVTGPLAAAYQAVDWAATPLGASSSWSETLVSTSKLMLDSGFPIALMWGPELVLLYNEAYVPLMGEKHPALGRPVREVIPEAWELVGPMLSSVLRGQGASWSEDRYVPMRRRGFLEEAYFTFSYSPVRNLDGGVDGVMEIATETTRQVISSRRLHILTQLQRQLADVQRIEEVSLRALPLLRADRRDFPAVDVRLDGVTPDREPGLPDHPPDASGRDLIMETHGDSRVAWLPLSTPDSPERSYLVASLAPLLAPDEPYLGFLRLVASTLREALDRVRVRSAERRTADAQRFMSEAFQRQLLPRPQPAGYPEVVVRYQPAAEAADFGGDWYDLFELPDESVVLVVGDVAGHDQDAAAAMAKVRNMLRGIAYTMAPAALSEVLRALDRAMDGLTTGFVATVVLAKVNGSASEGFTLTWSNAGHPPPVLIEPDGTSRLLETAPELLLGANYRSPRTDHRAPLRPGATVIFFTDGLIERRGVSFSDGLAWLCRLLRNRQHMSADEVADLVLRDTPGTEDDVALLVLRL